MWEWDETVWHRTPEYLLSFEEPGLVFARPDAQLVAERYALFYFYPSEPFHFYELFAAQPPHDLDGWYCNINLPPQRVSDGYSYVDIDLDVWVYPDLSYDILDEDEYREHAGRYNYPAAFRELAERTIDLLRRRIECVTYPFRRSVQPLDVELAALAAHFDRAPLVRSTLTVK